MSDPAQAVFTQTIIMFIIVIIGMLCCKFRLINDDGKKQLSNLVLTVVNPLLIFLSYQTDLRPELIEGFLWTCLMAVITYVVFILLSYVIYRNNERRETAIERFSSIYSNCGFMGTPLIFGVFGNDGVFIMNGFVTVFNLFVWTHGVILMSGNNGKEKNIVGSLLKAVRAPATIAVAAGLLCLFTGIRLPEIITSALTNVAEMTTPLAMIVAGVSIMSAGIIKSIRNPRVYLTAAVRLLLFPAIGFAIIMFMPCEIMPKLITLIEFSCPVAAMGTMFAIRYEQNAEYSSQIFAVSTLLSAVTLPMIVKLGSIVLEAISTV